MGPVAVTAVCDEEQTIVVASLGVARIVHPKIAYQFDGANPTTNGCFHPTLPGNPSDTSAAHWSPSLSLDFCCGDFSDRGRL